MAEPELLDKRLLECIQGKQIFPLYRSVDGLRHASPALSFQITYAAGDPAPAAIRMIARDGWRSSPSVINAATRSTLAIGSLDLDPGGVDDDFPVAYLV